MRPILLALGILLLLAGCMAAPTTPTPDVAVLQTQAAALNAVATARAIAIPTARPPVDLTREALGIAAYNAASTLILSADPATQTAAAATLTAIAATQTALPAP